MVDWYRHDIPSWMDGTDMLDDTCYRIYHNVVMMIYLHEGPITFNERGIAGKCGAMHLNKFRPALARLIEMGKLEIREGKLSNPRCNREIDRVQLNRTHAGLGGQAPRNTRKTNGSGGATLHNFGAYKSRVEEGSEE